MIICLVGCKMGLAGLGSVALATVLVIASQGLIVRKMSQNSVALTSCRDERLAVSIDALKSRQG